MKKTTTTLSTVIDLEVKRAATLYCKQHGMKLQYLVEKALIEQLEDSIDLQAYREREKEPTTSLEDILAARKK